jgi:hypothetical protein
LGFGGDTTGANQPATWAIPNTTTLYAGRLEFGEVERQIWGIFSLMGKANRMAMADQRHVFESRSFSFHHGQWQDVDRRNS